MNSKVYPIVERVIGLILLTVCTLLIIQNKELKKQLELSGYSGNTFVEPLEPGEVATPIQCFEIDGKRSTIEYSGNYNQYLLFVFSTQCPHCEKSLPYIEKIASEVVDSPVELIGVSMHGLKETQGDCAVLS